MQDVRGCKGPEAQLPRCGVQGMQQRDSEEKIGKKMRAHSDQHSPCEPACTKDADRCMLLAWRTCTITDARTAFVLQEHAGHAAVAPVADSPGNAHATHEPCRFTGPHPTPASANAPRCVASLLNLCLIDQ